MKTKLLIIGASGHGRVLADIALSMNQWQEIFFLDDRDDIKHSMGAEVIGRSDQWEKYIDHYDFSVGIGDNRTRERIHTNLKIAGASIPTLIHPSAVIGRDVRVGDGSAVMAGAVINCGSRIGEACIINTGSTIDHDNILEDFVHVSPGAHLAGTVRIGKGTWLGAGSVVINNISIIGNCIIGAGAVVIDDIVEAGTYVGVPAKRR
jgi:sugar O-acyltransferase (sialic acid O-acetyltransferase NeuD family)